MSMGGITHAIILCSIIFLSSLSGTVYAQIQNGSFESGTNPGSYLNVSAPNNTTITGWSVVSADIDYIGTYWQAADGVRSIDLSGNVGSAGAIQQTFPTTIGATYYVTFSLAGNPDGPQGIKTLQVSASPCSGCLPQTYNFDTTGRSRTNMGWVDRTYVFTATGASTTITFASLISSGWGPAIDNVRISLTPPPPPPPPPQIQNGGFESGTNPGSYLNVSAPNNTTITGWSVISADIDYIGTYWQAADGVRSIDLSGNIGSAGAIQQTFPTTAGATYYITFSLAGNPDGPQGIKTLQVSASPCSGCLPQTYNFDTTGRSRTNMGWVDRTYVFTATGASTTITFASLTSSGWGPALDNVRETHILPHSLPHSTGANTYMIGLSAIATVFSGLMILRRKRFKKA